MSLSVGIVGLPNVGKSTLFNALLKSQQALAANYPFATIEPNIGVVPVPDDRLEAIAKVIESHSKILPPLVPATVMFTDIAGIVKGASEGEGLGNQFLSHIREVSAIAFVIRAFKDGDVVQTGEGDFGKDLETVKTELALADLETLNKQREPKGKIEKAEIIRWQVIQKVKKYLEDGSTNYKLSEEEQDLIYDLNLLSSKPAIYVINVSETELGSENLIQDAASKLSVNSDDVVIICAKTESELSNLSSVDQVEYLKSLNVEKSGLENLIESAYKKLGLISFLTAGEKEVRAWTISNRTKAPQAAAVIHTDFEKHFIKAIVCSYTDFISAGGWQKAKEKGLVRTEGREYIVKSDDIVEFMIGK
jgi:GTP-binding protein YchF